VVGWAGDPGPMGGAFPFHLRPVISAVIPRNEYGSPKCAQDRRNVLRLPVPHGMLTRQRTAQSLGLPMPPIKIAIREGAKPQAVCGFECLTVPHGAAAGRFWAAALGSRGAPQEGRPPYRLHAFRIAPAHTRVAVLGDKGQGPQGGICGMVQLRQAGAFLLTRTSVRPLPVTRQCPSMREAAAIGPGLHSAASGTMQEDP
jgi:hypothetical protein